MSTVKIELKGNNRLEIKSRYGMYEIVVNENDGVLNIREVSGKSLFVIPQASNSIKLDGFKE